MRVLAAMSGGVDSAVAAALCVRAGHDVVGVHMALSQNPRACRLGARGCCSIEDAGDAARAAQAIGIPFYVWDLAERFEQTVVADFLAQYRAGRTPNPCVRCNEYVKFRELAGRARALGFDAVCTGHYARIVAGPAGPELHRSRDLAKDQSYVLAVMGREELSRVLFPIGEAPSKAWVRAQAEQMGLGVAHKRDSYDICFIPDGDTQGFLRARLGERRGDIVDQRGRVLGHHRGYYRYTVGQRRGLGLGRPSEDGRPRYVVATNPRANQVVVGPRDALRVDRVRCAHAVWLAGEDRGETGGRGPLTVQMRAHGRALPVRRVAHSASGAVDVRLAVPALGVAAGQSLVLYRGTRVLAQATIQSAERSRRPDGDRANAQVPPTTVGA